MNIENIIVHCSATPPDRDIGAADIDQWHRAKGWRCIGYHYVIRRGGIREEGRPVGTPGAHTMGFNHNSIGICLAGGVDGYGDAQDNFDDDQKLDLADLLLELQADYPDAKIRGHRDYSPDLNGDGVITSNEYLKDCPCFDVREFCEDVGIKHN